MFNLMAMEKTIEHGLMSLRVLFHEPELKALHRYVTELTKWNERINLVGLKNPESIVQELLNDAFFLNGYVKDNESILDMGSGAGILAIPLAILNREAKVFSADRTLKKIQFQRHIQRTLGLANFHPVHGRIELIEPLKVDSLVVKAFGSITDILIKGGKHIVSNGHAFLLKGITQPPENVDSFILEDMIPYVLPDGTKNRTLFIYSKRE